MDKIVKYVPNFLTMLNMLLGFTSIQLLIRDAYPQNALIIAALILLGGIIDFFDGYIARKFNAVSNMGKQLDSFADLITFGIAPSCLAYYMAPHEYSLPVAISCGVFIMAGSYRLARYNIHDFNDYFMGLPITSAGILLGVYCAAQTHWGIYHQSSIWAIITTIFIFLLSIMMVSKVKIKRLHIRKIANVGSGDGRSH